MELSTEVVLADAHTKARERTIRFSALMLANLQADDAAAERLTYEYAKLAGHNANLYLALGDALRWAQAQ